MIGLYSVLEGMDKAGKSTTARKVVEILKVRGYNVTWVNEPFSATDEFLAIRKLITDGNLEHNTKGLLALASRIELYQKVIKPALDRGDIVVSERNFISTLIYQGQHNPDPLHAIHLIAFQELELDLIPDVLITLEIDYPTFKARSEALEDLDVIEQYLLKEEHFEAYRARYAGCVDKATTGTKTEVIKYTDLVTLADHLEQCYLAQQAKK